MKALLSFALCLSFSVLSAQQPKGIQPITNNPSTDHQTRAVVIGISDYQDPAIPDLRFADRDAEAFANFLRSPAGGALDNNHLVMLTNSQATAGRVAEAFDALIEQAQEGDEVIIYFSGHGDVEGKKISQPGFLLCWDAPSRVYMGGGTYSLAYLQEVVSTLSLGNKAKVMVITDACHAGKLAGSQIGGAQITGANLARQYANEVKILSCQPGEFSLEGEQWGGGRGVFSYHLVDGLFGLADRNADGQVSLGEIDRYLEDHVTAEAAPEHQVPILLGNKSERLATVVPAILANLQQFKAGQLPAFAPTEGRGFEDDILAEVDSNILMLYKAFNLAVKEKRFFSPAENNADALYARLARVEALAPLRGFMKRNYAAALQDDAQQAMNILLKADVQQLACIGKTLHPDPIPVQLTRAAELLGEKHYMYPSLIARKLLFEGLALGWRKRLSNPGSGRQQLNLYWQAQALEPQSPLTWYLMSHVYLQDLHRADSAFICVREARRLAPNWVLPFADLAYLLGDYGETALEAEALQEAEAIDSLHPYTINRRAFWYKERGEPDKAAVLFERYRAAGGPMYPCWYNDFAIVLETLGNYEQAESELNKAMALDSNNEAILGHLGNIYLSTRRFAEAAVVIQKALALDSLNAVSWSDLAGAYLFTGRREEAEPAYRKAVALDPGCARCWAAYGYFFYDGKRYDEAETTYKKSLALDSTVAVTWTNLGNTYYRTSRYPEAEKSFARAIALNPSFPIPRQQLAMVYLRTQRLAEARQGFRLVMEMEPDLPLPLIGMAAADALEGNISEALEYATRAIGKGASFQQLQQSKDLAPLRERPEWKPLMKQYFPDQVKD